MKKTIKTGIIAIVLTGLALGSCKKNANRLQEHQTDTTIEQVHGLVAKYKYAQRFMNDKTEKEASTERKVALALSDAVGAALGSGLGIYGALWGGFLATLGTEGYVRDKKIPTMPQGTGSHVFEHGDVGDGHNILMYNALMDDSTNADHDTTFNARVKYLMINTVFQLTPVQQSQASIYTDLEHRLIIHQDYIVGNIVDSTVDSSYIQNIVLNANLTDDAKSIISTVVADIFANNIFAGSFCTSYLDDVETTINASPYSPATKEQIKYFLAVANSSNYFWQTNY